LAAVQPCSAQFSTCQLRPFAFSPLTTAVFGRCPFVPVPSPARQIPPFGSVLPFFLTVSPSDLWLSFLFFFASVFRFLSLSTCPTSSPRFPLFLSQPFHVLSNPSYQFGTSVFQPLFTCAGALLRELFLGLLILSRYVTRLSQCTLGLHRWISEPYLSEHSAGVLTPPSTYFPR